jgi:hypothetical protein
MSAVLGLLAPQGLRVLQAAAQAQAGQEHKARQARTARMVRMASQDPQGLLAHPVQQARTVKTDSLGLQGPL